MKRNFQFGFFAVVAIFAFASCVKDKNVELEENFLNYQIEDVPVNQDIAIGAYYYTINFTTGTDLIMYNRIIEQRDDKTGLKPGPYVKPILGRYAMNFSSSYSKLDSTRFIVQQHVQWADSAGINFLVLPMIKENPTISYPNNLNASDTTQINFMIGSTPGYPINWGNLKFALMVDMNTLCAAVAKGNKKLDNNNLAENVAPTQVVDQYGKTISISFINRFHAYFRAVSNYFKRPNYYKINGKPVIIISSPQTLYASACDVLYSNMRDTLKKYSGASIYLIARQQQWTPPARFHDFFLKGKSVDAVTMDKMYIASYKERSYLFPQAIDQNFKYNREYDMANYGVDFVPSLSTSYNGYVDGIVNPNYQNPRVDKDINTFRTIGNVAKMNLGKTPIVLIDGFNAWQFDSALEPTVQGYGLGYGKTYLDMIKQMFRK
jgi:hypothetical protein